MAMQAAAVLGSRRRFGGGGFSRTRYDEDDSDGPSMCWITIFAVCGISLLVTGVVYARSSFEDPRAELVAQYNADVDLWNEKLRPQFEQSQFSWRLLNPHHVEVKVPAVTCPEEPEAGVECTPRNASTESKMVTLNLTQAEKEKIAWERMGHVDKEDHLAKPQKIDDIHTYEELVYGAGGMFPERADGEWDETTWTGAPYMLELRAEMPNGEAQVFNIGPVPLMKQNMIGANQKMCRIHYGNNMHHGHCWDTFALSQICVQLNQTADGWTADINGNIGCNGRDAAVYDKHCPGSHRLLTPNTPPCDFSAVNVSVRSSADPHTKALLLTAGTLNFGPTPGDNWNQGIVMLVVGALLLCPVAPVLYYKLWSKRRSYHDAMFSDFNSVRTASSRSRSISPHTRVEIDEDGDAVYADGGVARGTVVRETASSRRYAAHDML